MQRKRLSPSDGAAPSAMMASQHNTAMPLLNGRPEDCSAPPISIFHPIFKQFTNLLKAEDALEDRQLRAASDFMHVGAEYYADEHLRQFALIPLMRILMPGITSGLQFHYDVNGFKPDMGRQVECGVYSERVIQYRDFLANIVELKNGVGSGKCDPTDQGAQVYLIQASSSDVSGSPHFLPVSQPDVLPVPRIARVLMHACFSLVYSGAIHGRAWRDLCRPRYMPAAGLHLPHTFLSSPAGCRHVPP